MKLLPRLLTGLVALALSAAGATACPYSIRDAGFIVRDPVPYRLVVLACNASPAARATLQTSLEQLISDSFGSANVRPVVLDPRQKTDDPQLRQLLATHGKACETGVQYVLLRPDGESLAMDTPAGAEAATRHKALLAAVVDSPARRDLVRQIITAWCAVVVVQGTDLPQNRAMVGAAEAAARKLVGFKPEMHDPITAAPPVLALKWDDPAEGVLRFALGLDEGDCRQARAAVVFGRGRRVGPVLTAAKATEGRFQELFHLLGKNCTCTADPAWLLGPALPLNWGRDLQQQVREALGFDPNSPAVAATLSGVWKTLRTSDSALVPGETVPEPTTGYVEFGVEPGEAPTKAADPDAPADDRDAGLGQRSWNAARWTAAGLTAAALGGTAIVVWRALKRS